MKQDISQTNIQLENEGKFLPSPMIAPASGPSSKIHGPPLEPFHKLQVTPKKSVRLSQLPYLKFPEQKFSCAVWWHYLSRAFPPTCTLMYISFRISIKSHRERKLIQLFLELNRSFLFNHPSVRFNNSSVKPQASDLPSRLQILLVYLLAFHKKFRAHPIWPWRILV